MSPPDDRAAILKRRALFLGSALATLGSCQKSGVPAETAPGPVIAVPAGEPEDAGASEGEPSARDAGPRSRGDMPSLEIPSGVSEAARSNYESLITRMRRVHALLDDIERMAPKCGMNACEDQWLPVAKKLFDLDDSFGFSYVCPGSSDDAKAFFVRRQEHLDFYEARRKDVTVWLTGQLGEPGWARLQELVELERLANPRPCLSYGCSDW